MAATNPFTPPTSPVGPGPVVHGFVITPSDSTVFDHATRYLWIGASGGNVAVRLAGDTTPVTLNAVAAGTMLEVCCVQVMATDTTATDVVGLYSTEADMPLTAKGTKIMGAMKQQYGSEAEAVFYASKNKGTISGVDGADCPQHGYMDACRRGDAAGMTAHSGTMLRGRIVR